MEYKTENIETIKGFTFQFGFVSARIISHHYVKFKRDWITVNAYRETISKGVCYCRGGVACILHAPFFTKHYLKIRNLLDPCRLKELEEEHLRRVDILKQKRMSKR